MTRTDKTAAFRALHRPGEPFVMPNPWDAGTARMLAAMGAQALATTSAGHAFTLGRPDMGHVRRDEALAHAAEIVVATPLPVSGDLENGYGESPETVAETVRMAAEAGLAGLSIEDTAVPGKDAYPIELTIARAEAAIAAAREADIVLTLRADGVMNGTYDEAEALTRAQAYAAAGAEVIYVPLGGPDTVRRLAALGPAVNLLAAGRYVTMSLDDMGSLGAARISVGSMLARVGQRAVLEAGRAMLEAGDFTDLDNAAQGAEIDRLLQDGAAA